MSVITLLDLEQLHPGSFERKMLDEVYLSAPAFNKLPSRVISGTSYIYQKRDTLPKIGARPINAGADVHKASWKTERAECYFYDGRIEVDKALILAEPENKKYLMEDNAKATMKGTMFGLEQSLFYDTPFGVKSIRSQLGDYMAISADPEIKDETAWTAGGTSVWFVHVSSDAIRLDWGNRQVLKFGPLYESLVPRAKADGTMGAMKAVAQDCQFWVGLNVLNEFAVGSLLNVTERNPLTDEMMDKAMSLFPEAMKPNLIIMNPFARRLLKQSRTKALTYVKGGKGGQSVNAPTPTEYDGIPILVTDGILNDETPENIAKFVAQSEFSMDNLKQKEVGITNPNNKSKV